MQEPVDVPENEKEIRDKIYFYRAIDSDDYESESDEDSDDEDDRIVASRGKVWNLTKYRIHACNNIVISEIIFLSCRSF